MSNAPEKDRLVNKVFAPDVASKQIDTRHIRPKTGAAPFEVDELFFSRTDKRGVILAFNNVFQRIAHFETDKLLNAPHKLIRHPDMPRGVFWIMWHRLNKGLPITAYVKNRASDGLYYWVYAFVTPIDDGYLSIRMKPTTPLLGVIEGAYKLLLSAEKNDGASPEDSARAAAAFLAENGYSSYSSFMAQSMAREVLRRDEILGRQPDTLVLSMLKLLDATSKIRETRREITQHFKDISLIPMNMRINAARIERQGGPISAISENYKTMSQEVMEELRSFVLNVETDPLLSSNDEEEGLFLYCASRFATEAHQFFSADAVAIEGVDADNENQWLNRIEADYTARAHQAMESAYASASRLVAQADRLRRAVLGLDSTRILCRVESGRLRGKANGLDAIVEKLDTFHNTINAQLDGIASAAASAKSRADEVLEEWSFARKKQAKAAAKAQSLERFLDPNWRAGQK